MSGFYYAVAKGRRPGVYETWDECKEQVHGFFSPVFKKFPTSEEAQAFIDRHRCVLSKSNPSPEDLVFLGGGRGVVKSSSKRVLDSVDFNENETAVESSLASTKRIKRVTMSSNGKNEKKHFDMDSNGFVNVYTDGACTMNGRPGAKAGVGVYFGDDSPLNVSEPVVGRATNNMAEIQAVTRAAEIARQVGITKLRINTDSKFLIQSVTEWMPGWKARGWINSANKPVVNRRELEEMEAALNSLTVQWNHVRGHRGIHGNEMADKLARLGAERYLRD